MKPSEIRRKKLEEISEFFTDVTSPESFAKDARRFLYESMKMALTPPELRYIPDPDWINRGITNINMFCEVLKPVLEEEDNEVTDYISL